MSHRIINSNHLFLLKKINCLKLYNLKAKFVKLFIKLANFNKNKKCNYIIFIYYSNILLKNMR